MFADNLQKQLENISIWFQGGVRRSIIIFTAVVLCLLAPIYFLGIFTSTTWFRLFANPSRLDTASYFIPKFIDEKPLIISPTQVVPLKDGSNELYFSINNKDNPEIGFYPFVYDIQVLDKNGAAINQETRTSYILPGDTRYITYKSPDGRADRLIINRNNQTTPIYYNPLSKKFKKPDIVVSNEKYTLRTFTNYMNIGFTLKNRDKVNIKNVDIIFTVRDKQDSIIGVGDFAVSDLAPGEQRDIDIPYIQHLERTASNVEIIPLVNFLELDNFYLSKDAN